MIQPISSLQGHTEVPSRTPQCSLTSPLTNSEDTVQQNSQPSVTHHTRFLAVLLLSESSTPAPQPSSLVPSCHSHPPMFPATPPCSAAASTHVDVMSSCRTSSPPRRSDLNEGLPSAVNTSPSARLCLCAPRALAGAAVLGCSRERFHLALILPFRVLLCLRVLPLLGLLLLLLNHHLARDVAAHTHATLTRAAPQAPCKTRTPAIRLWCWPTSGCAPGAAFRCPPHPNRCLQPLTHNTTHRSP